MDHLDAVARKEQGRPAASERDVVGVPRAPAGPAMAAVKAIEEATSKRITATELDVGFIRMRF